jgi:hypothetical protein
MMWPVEAPSPFTSAPSFVGGSHGYLCTSRTRSCCGRGAVDEAKLDRVAALPFPADERVKDPEVFRRRTRHRLVFGSARPSVLSGRTGETLRAEWAF